MILSFKQQIKETEQILLHEYNTDTDTATGGYLETKEQFEIMLKILNSAQDNKFLDFTL